MHLQSPGKPAEGLTRCGGQFGISQWFRRFTLVSSNSVGDSPEMAL